MACSLQMPLLFLRLSRTKACPIATGKYIGIGTKGVSAYFIFGLYMRQSFFLYMFEILVFPMLFIQKVGKLPLII
jgi:hypothetical protein